MHQLKDVMCMAGSGSIIVHLTTHKVHAHRLHIPVVRYIYIVAARCALIFPDGLAGLKLSWTAVRTASRQLQTCLDRFEAVQTALKLAGQFIISLDGFNTVLWLTIGP